MKKRTKALAIPPAVKIAVAKRDSVDDWPVCVLCGLPAPMDAPLAFSCAHYIPRSQGGLGIEENILTLCPADHRLYDQSEYRAVYKPILRRYLMDHYPGWNESELVYKK